MRCLLPLLLMTLPCLPQTIPDALKKSVTFHASFDRGLDAEHARGDARIHSAPDYKQLSSAQPGKGQVDVSVAKGEGLRGSDALRFASKNTKALFFRGKDHATPAAGTVSFWLRLDPQKDLAPGFCDPIQVTDKAYNDSAIWVDFTKDEVPRHFRLGVFGELKAWNPDNIPPDRNPAFMNRLVVIKQPPFSRDRWTHVAIAWSQLGSGNGSAALFVNGQKISSAQKIGEPFRWDPDNLSIRLGVNYTGLMDDVALFDRPLNDKEILSLYQTGSAK
jgi:hypothetical protein